MNFLTNNFASIMSFQNLPFKESLTKEEEDTNKNSTSVKETNE